jgi:hypothetical protein
MRNFDAFAVALIAIIMLGFSEIHLTPEPWLGQGRSELRTAMRFQQAVLREQILAQVRNQIQVLRCPNR